MPEGDQAESCVVQYTEGRQTVGPRDVTVPCRTRVCVCARHDRVEWPARGEAAGKHARPHFPRHGAGGGGWGGARLEAFAVALLREVVAVEVEAPQRPAQRVRQTQTERPTTWDGGSLRVSGESRTRSTSLSRECFMPV